MTVKSKKSPAGGSSEFASINKQLRSFGLRLRDVLGDGNCLFRALAHQLHGAEAPHHKTLREQTTTHMRQHAHLYAPFVDESVEPINHRIARMQKLGIFADNLEIVAFSRALLVTVVIHQDGVQPWIVAGFDDDGDTAPAAQNQVLHIVYHPWEHYSSVEPIDDHSTSLPRGPKVKNSNEKKIEKQKITMSVAERVVLASIPSHLDASIETVRYLLNEYHGDIGKVVEAFVAETYADLSDDDEKIKVPLIQNSVNASEKSDKSPSGKNTPTSTKDIDTTKPQQQPSRKQSNLKQSAPPPRQSAREKKEAKKRMQKENSLAKKRIVPTPQVKPLAKGRNVIQAENLAEQLNATYI
ncbi:OTU domain-containing protein 3 [Entophlyctis luteolus]|nr:OTU domain-containing protein 3 [Entophlyctis luteolus]